MREDVPLGSGMSDEKQCRPVEVVAKQNPQVGLGFGPLQCGDCDMSQGGSHLDLGFGSHKPPEHPGLCAMSHQLQQQPMGSCEEGNSDIATAPAKALSSDESAMVSIRRDLFQRSGIDHGLKDAVGLGTKMHSNDSAPGSPSCPASDVSSEAPVNPRLPWPRFEPSLPVLQSTELDSLLPTQRFNVYVRMGTSDTLVHHELVEQSQVKAWTPGGLRGGLAGHDDVVSPRQCLRHSGLSEGWWLHLWGERWCQIPLHKVRQEREALGLQGVDTTRTTITLLSDEGPMSVKWNYKFPFTANGRVIIVVAPCGLPLSLLWNCLNKRGEEHATGILMDEGSWTSDSVNTVSSNTSQSTRASSYTHKRRPKQQRHHYRTGRGSCSLPANMQAENRGREPIPVASAIFIILAIGTWKCARKQAGRTVAQVLEEEWDISPESYCILLNGKCISPTTSSAAVPSGIPLRLTGRLRGGVPSHTKKLRDLLLSKGVPEDELSSRIAEIASAVGDSAVAEAFACFDPWQALKSKCQGKLRIIKQTEARGSKPKKPELEEDRLQTQDPWAEALQHRHLKPEAAFFHTATKQPPNILQTVTHGCSGLAIVDLKEAQLLARSCLQMS